MFDRFTEKAIKTIMLAQDEARDSAHNYIGVEQIFLGLIGLREGIAYDSLIKFNIDLDKARLEVRSIVPRGSDNLMEEVPFTPRSKRVLELTWDEAFQLRHNYIASEHLLLGIIREGESVAVRVLQNLGVDLGALKSTVLESIAELFKAELVIDPQNMASLGCLARVLFLLERFDEANKYYSKALMLPGGKY